MTNLRFADDVLVIAGSLEIITDMLTDIANEATAFGLELHPGKTKILSNVRKRKGQEQHEHAKVGQASIEILKHEDSTKYLGRKLTFANYHETEIDNRIDNAWRKFHTLKAELCNKYYSLRHRLRLFDAVVTPTVLYGAGTWTMTQELEHKLRKTQRQMLRHMLGFVNKRKQATKTPRHRYQGEQTTTQSETSKHPDNDSDDKDEPTDEDNGDDDDDDDADDEDGDHVNTSASARVRETGGEEDNDDDEEEEEGEGGEEDEESADHVATAATTSAAAERGQEWEEEEGEEEEETWVEWIRRATRGVEDQLRKLQIDDWVVAQRKRKWQWAGHVARRVDGRWSAELLVWMPPGGRLQGETGKGRKRGHPKRRWEDCINNFFATKFDMGGVRWMDLAQNREEWAGHESAFASFDWSKDFCKKTLSILNTNH